MLETSEIIALRPDKNEVRPDRPYHFLYERERDSEGALKKINTIFLTNSECPFKCVMCDLWKNTLNEPVEQGAVPAQIAYALKRLPEAQVIKLYNSGNFFDRKAIPPADYPAIARLLDTYERVIIENHPKLCGEACLEFNQLLQGELEIAMGLETIHPEVLPRLNKKITKEDFAEAVDYLGQYDIDSRAFVLLNPPFLTDPRDNIHWTVKSVAFALECGVTACSIIPTRGGNGAMEKLREQGAYVPPTLGTIEKAFEQALQLRGTRVFLDLWDIEQFADCSHCLEYRKRRLKKMNREQQVQPPTTCSHCKK